MEKTKQQPRLRKLRNVVNGDVVIAKPQTTKIVSIRVDSKKDPGDLLESNMDIFVEELAKRIAREVQANSNFVRIETFDDNGFKKTYISVRLLSNERKYLPKITVSS